MKRLFLILILPLVYVFSQDCTPTDSLIHQWSFNVGASDTVGTLDGTLYGGADAPYLDIGINKNCYRFDDRDAWIDFDYFYPNVGNFSLGFWFLCNTDSVTRVIYGIKDDYRLQLRLVGNYIEFIYHDNVNQQLSSNTLSFADSSWHFTVATYDSGIVSLYYDGGLQNIDTALRDTISGYRYDLRMCTGAVFEDRFEDGMIDEPFIFNRALDSCEIYDMWSNRSNLGGFFEYDSVCSCVETDTFLIDWNGIDLDLIEWNGIDIDLIQSINGINLK